MEKSNQLEKGNAIVKTLALCVYVFCATTFMFTLMKAMALHFGIAYMMNGLFIFYGTLPIQLTLLCGMVVLGAAFMCYHVLWICENWEKLVNFCQNTYKFVENALKKGIDKIIGWKKIEDNSLT